MNKKLTTTLLLTALVVFAGATGTTQAADLQLREMPAESFQIPNQTAKQSGPPSGIYIVQMKGDPVIAYAGDIPGFKATMLSKGSKLQLGDADVQKYAAYLKSNHDEIIQSIGADKVHNYRYGINGFAARMTPEQANKLMARDDVVNVWRDEILQLQHTTTDNGPKYLGLTRSGNAWAQGIVGENVVIGILDSGIWPEHPSFADVPTRKKGNRGKNIPYGSLPSTFTPSGCDFGNTAANGLDADFSCNNKLVAARCYNSGFSSATDPSNPCGGNAEFVIPTEFQSARDNDGHGSHAASIAGGNFGVQASIAGKILGKISGNAPRARIAVYKVCWNGLAPPALFSRGCASSDTAAAIDQAVADGVDVLNFSVGDSSTAFSGFDDIAFLFATDAGVYVATANGNNGPGVQTIGTPAGVPWITAVGASQDSGVFGLAITVDSPRSIAGDKTALEGNGDVSLEDTGTITDAVTLTSPADGCVPVDAVSGIALTIRGGCNFSNKYNNAAAAGAIAIIVYSDGTTPKRVDPIVMTAPGTTIPGVMVGFNDGDAMAAVSGVTTTLDPDKQVNRRNRVAGLSLRGPNSGAPDIIKPDIAAPGVTILAAHTPIPNGGRTPGELFQNLSGTSMASPHVAGAFAMIKQRHPDWTAAQAKSALMTTARRSIKKTFGKTKADAFDIGAGEIQPTKALDPGLTYGTGLFDYLAFSCGNNIQLISDAQCEDLKSVGFSFDGSDLNLASIGIEELVGSQTVRRTVTSVTDRSNTYLVRVKAPKGVHVTVTPRALHLKAGESATYQVTFETKKEAVLNEWTFGLLTWKGTGGYKVHSPIAVRPIAFTTLAEVDGSDDGKGNGSLSIPLEFGYKGAYNAVVSGLNTGLSIPGNISMDEGFDTLCVDSPANTHFRMATFDEDTTTPGADNINIRLLLAQPDCATGSIVAQLGASDNFGSEEVIDVADGPAGGYVLVIDYIAAAVGDNIDYTVWAQPVFGDADNTTVTAPTSAVSSASDTVIVNYSDVADTRNLGVLIHQDGNGEISRTILDVDAR